MAGREEKSRYELLEISDPSTLLVRGENKNYHKHYPYIINRCPINPNGHENG